MKFALRAEVAAPFNTSPIRGIEVLIISSDAETLGGTYDYLSRAGALPQGVTTLSAGLGAAKNARAVILFADDYPKEGATEMLRELRKKRLDANIIVVSDQTDVFAAVDESDDLLTVLRRPTWGWMLLDAIRARLESAPSTEP